MSNSPHGKIVILFRHADKQLSSGANPGLSNAGKSQAQNLNLLCVDKKIPAPQKIWVSPKVRTRESMEVVSRHFGVECEEFRDLAERQSRETSLQFYARIQKVLSQAAAEKGPIFICTHYDWLEEGLAFIPTPDDQPTMSNFSWHPLSYLAFEIIEGRWHLFTKGQILP